MLITPTHHIGVPTHAGPLTVFPVWTDAPVPRRAIRTVVPKKATVQTGNTVRGPAWVGTPM